jgi:FkbM family methyltransferase
MSKVSNEMPPRLQKYVLSKDRKKQEVVVIPVSEKEISYLIKDEMFFGEIQEGKHVDEVLRGYFPDYSYKGIFFDVGAFEPIRISNSHHFHQSGWEVYSFEANPAKIPLLEQHRQHVFNYAVADQDTDEPLPFENVIINNEWTASFSAIKVSDKYKEIFGWDDNLHRVETILVKQKTLNTIIQQEIPDLSHIDIMSLDIEGYELQCLNGLDLGKYPPKVIVLENADHNQDVKDHLGKNGYRLDKQVSYNEYYVHNSYVHIDTIQQEKKNTIKNIRER